MFTSNPCSMVPSTFEALLQKIWLVSGCFYRTDRQRSNEDNNVSWVMRYSMHDGLQSYFSIPPTARPSIWPAGLAYLLIQSGPAIFLFANSRQRYSPQKWHYYYSWLWPVTEHTYRATHACRRNIHFICRGHACPSIQDLLAPTAANRQPDTW